MDSIKDLLGQIIILIINPLIILAFVVATAYLFYSIIQMIWNSDGSNLAEKRKSVIYGIVGMFVMFSVYGILKIVLETLKIKCEFFFC